MYIQLLCGMSESIDESKEWKWWTGYYITEWRMTLCNRMLFKCISVNVEEEKKDWEHSLFTIYVIDLRAWGTFNFPSTHPNSKWHLDILCSPHRELLIIAEHRFLKSGYQLLKILEMAKLIIQRRLILEPSSMFWEMMDSLICSNTSIDSDQDNAVPS